MELIAVALLFLLVCVDSVFFNPTLCNWKEDPNSDLCKHASHEALRQVAIGLLGDPKTMPPFNPLYPNATKLPCQLEEFGKGYGVHGLCGNPALYKNKDESKCNFYSFGVQRDYSFDTHLSKTWDCSGFLFDPTVNHNSLLANRMMFFAFGANMLYKNDLGGAGADNTRELEKWITISPSKFMKFMDHTNLNILKMDCEGCEYAVARDIALEDPRFFSKVSQFTTEVHISKSWIKSHAYLHYLGLLYHILFREGFYLTWHLLAGCGPEEEATGCPQKLLDVNYPCGNGKMCHNYLFTKL